MAVTPRGMNTSGSGRRVYENAGAPTNGTSGTLAGSAKKGSLLVDTTNAVLYINTNTQLSPTWSSAATTSAKLTAFLAAVPTPAIAQVASANATDLASAETLANEIKAKLNTLLTQLGSGAGGAAILT